MKKQLRRVTLLLLSLSLLLIPLSSCSACSVGTPMLELKIDGKTYTYPAELYELQLSILKGNLAVAGYTINGKNALQNAFWDMTDDFDGSGKLQTTDEYYRGVILRECRYVLIAQYLFDKYDLELSEATLEEINDYLNEFVETDGDGNVNKLNSVLADYGVNYELLEEYLIMNAKLEAVQNHLYSRLGHNVKQNYLEETYVHFDQIFLANYNYVYETDKYGDEIYFNEADGSVLYRVTPYTELVSGQVIYYTDATKTHVSYDTENGVRSYKLTADGTGYETTPKSDAELDALDDQLDALLTNLADATPAQFTALVSELSDGETYGDGYYLQKGLEYSSGNDNLYYLDQIMERLETAEVGDVFHVESSMGYHIVMKLAHTEKAYELEENEAWFESSYSTTFTDALTAKIFRSECDKLYDKVTIDEKVYADVKTLKDVLPNYYYK
ncbi:MAG: hypothetical protein IJW29_04905 [Clostridia bacterium]|nr:hypothetical protein [Clostridia bacterium]